MLKSRGREKLRVGQLDRGRNRRQTRACFWIKIEDQSAVSKNGAGRCGRRVGDGERDDKMKSGPSADKRRSFRSTLPFISGYEGLQVGETLPSPLWKRMRVQKTPMFIVDFQIIRELLELCRLVFRH